MRLHRPYIPLSARVRVAERQIEQRGFFPDIIGMECPQRERLDALLRFLFRDEPVQLDHDPALVNRKRRTMRDGRIVYTPDANDPLYLIYRTKAEHDIKTRVRGDGAQLSDLAIARKRKRKERKAAKPKRRWLTGRKIQSRGFNATNRTKKPT